MLNLPQKTFSNIKKVLLRQQKEIEQNLKSLESKDGESLAESSEPGTDSWMAEMHGRTEVMKGNLMALLTRTKKSLSNLRSGKYGKCENCGKQIEQERLSAMPTATLCLSCSKKLAKKG